MKQRIIACTVQVGFLSQGWWDKILKEGRNSGAITLCERKPGNWPGKVYRIEGPLEKFYEFIYEKGLA